MGITKILVCIIAIPFVIILLFLSRALSRDAWDPQKKQYVVDHEGKLLSIMGFIGVLITIWALYEWVFNG